jgi:hypothetical protein
MALLIDTLVWLFSPAVGDFAMTRSEWPYRERYGYTWIQPPMACTTVRPIPVRMLTSPGWRSGGAGA